MSPASVLVAAPAAVVGGVIGLLMRGKGGGRRRRDRSRERERSRAGPATSPLPKTEHSVATQASEVSDVAMQVPDNRSRSVSSAESRGRRKRRPQRSRSSDAHREQQAPAAPPREAPTQGLTPKEPWPSRLYDSADLGSAATPSRLFGAMSPVRTVRTGMTLPTGLLPGGASVLLSADRTPAKELADTISRMAPTPSLGGGADATPESRRVAASVQGALAEQAQALVAVEAELRREAAALAAKERALAEMEAEISGRARREAEAAAERDTRLGERERRVQEREGRRQEDLSRRAEAMGERERDLHSRSLRLTAQEGALSGKESALLERAASLDKREREMDDKVRELEFREAEVAAAEARAVRLRDEGEQRVAEGMRRAAEDQEEAAAEVAAVAEERALLSEQRMALSAERAALTGEKGALALRRAEMDRGLEEVEATSKARLEEAQALATRVAEKEAVLSLKAKDLEGKERELMEREGILDAKEQSSENRARAKLSRMYAEQQRKQQELDAREAGLDKRDKELKAAEDTAGRNRAEAASARKEAEELRRAAARERSEAEERAEQLRHQEEDIAQRTVDLAKRQGALEARDEDLKIRETYVGEQMLALESREEDVRDKAKYGQVLAGKEAALSRKENDLAEREEAVRRRESALDKYEEAIRGSGASMAERERAVAERAALALEKESTAAKALMELAAREQALEAKEASIAAAVSENELRRPLPPVASAASTPDSQGSSGSVSVGVGKASTARVKRSVQSSGVQCSIDPASPSVSLSIMVREPREYPVDFSAVSFSDDSIVPPESRVLSPPEKAFEFDHGLGSPGHPNRSPDTTPFRTPKDAPPTLPAPSTAGSGLHLRPAGYKPPATPESLNTQNLNLYIRASNAEGAQEESTGGLAALDVVDVGPDAAAGDAQAVAGNVDLMTTSNGARDGTALALATPAVSNASVLTDDVVGLATATVLRVKTQARVVAEHAGAGNAADLERRLKEVADEAREEGDRRLTKEEGGMGHQVLTLGERIPSEGTLAPVQEEGEDLSADARRAHKHIDDQERLQTIERRLAAWEHDLGERQGRVERVEKDLAMREARLARENRQLKRSVAQSNGIDAGQAKELERKLEKLADEEEKLLVRELEIDGREEKIGRAEKRVLESVQNAKGADERAQEALATAQARLAEAETRLRAVAVREQQCDALSARAGQEAAEARELLKAGHAKETQAMTIAAQLEQQAKQLASDRLELKSLSENVAKREKTVEMTTASLQERSRVQEQQERNLQRRIGEIAEQENATRTLAEEARRSAAAVAEREGRVAAREETLQRREDAALQRETDLDNRTEVLEEEGRTLSKRARQLHVQEERLLDREARVTSRERSCDELEAALSHREELQADKKAESERLFRESLSQVIGPSDAAWLQDLMRSSGHDPVEVLSEVRSFKAKAREAQVDASHVLQKAKAVEAEVARREQAVMLAEAALRDSETKLRYSLDTFAGRFRDIEAKEKAQQEREKRLAAREGLADTVLRGLAGQVASSLPSKTFQGKVSTSRVAQSVHAGPNNVEPQPLALPALQESSSPLLGPERELLAEDAEMRSNARPLGHIVADQPYTTNTGAPPAVDISLTPDEDNAPDAPARQAVWGIGSPTSPRSRSLATSTGDGTVSECAGMRRSTSKKTSPQPRRDESARAGGASGIRESTPTTISTAHPEEGTLKAPRPSESSGSAGTSSASERWYSRARQQKSVVDASVSSDNVEQASPF